MGMTIIEKILARKAGLDSVSLGDTVVVGRRHDRPDRSAVRHHVDPAAAASTTPTSSPS